MKHIFFTTIKSMILLSVAALPFGLGATPVTPARSIFDLMHYREVIDVRIEANLDKLTKNRRAESPVEGRLSFEDENGNFRNWDIKVHLRGRFRRMFCAMPPLKIDFKKGQLEKSGLLPFDDLNLVSHCLSETTTAKNLLLREYLVYRLYNQITSYSFRVQLARVTFHNPATGERFKNWCFFIEDTAQLAYRIGRKRVRYNDIGDQTFDPEQVSRIALFQFLIGNADWKLEAGKNLKFFESPTAKLIPVPHDFDFAAIVKAPYAIPNNELAARDARAKALGGLPESFRISMDARRKILEKEPDLVETVTRFRFLSRDDRKEMVEYLQAGFDLLRPPGTKSFEN